MKILKFQKLKSGTLRELLNPFSSRTGSVLVYLIVVLLIFGVLGVTMVSLFTTSTSSSATPNDTRRAAYAFEAGMRYAFSELRNEEFATDTVSKLNSTAWYTLDSGQSFNINVFGPWFDFVSYSGNDLSLNVPEGKIPEGFTIPAGLWYVNYDHTGTDFDLSSTRNPVDTGSIATAGNTTLVIKTNGDFTATPGERICLAVKPSETTQSLTSGGDLYVERVAKDFFPKNYGAISINRRNYVYERLVDEPANNRVKLENITAASMPNLLTPLWFTVTNPGLDPYTGEFIVLSPRNHIVIPTGTSDTVTVGGTLDDGVNIYDTATAKAGRRNPDIEFAEEPNLDTSLTQKETDSGFINVDDTEKTVNIGGGGSTSDEFGGVWYNEDKAIGGNQNFCQAGECNFGLGVRTFFTLDYAGDGEGLTFALLNGALNDHTSSGGDIALAELIGYAGDSRKVTNPTVGSDYLDSTGNGLRPPKIAMEFDTRTDSGNFQYCNPVASTDPSASQENSRNDPLSADRDAVQYVFWGFDPTLAIPCRDDKPSYDDNRHDSGEGEHHWGKSGLGVLRSTPAVTDDGSVIYIGSDDGRLYAVNSDETIKWSYLTGGAVRSSPAIGDDGTIYVGSDDNYVYAINPNGTAKPAPWPFATGDDVRTSPVIGNSGDGNGANDIIYVGSDDSKFYALDANGNKLWDFTASGRISVGRAGFDPTGQKIYISDRNSYLYCLDIDRRENLLPFVSGSNGEWEFNLTDSNEYMPGVDPNNGAIYSDITGNALVAINPNGTEKWTIGNMGDVDSTPVVGADGIIYFGTDFQKLVAAYPDGTVKWEFTDSWGDFATIPAFAFDGTILAHRNDGNLYAVNPDGTEKWRFAVPVDPQWNVGIPASSATVASSGVIYIGSSDGNLYAINDFSVPRNIKEKMVTAVNDGSNTRVAGEIVAVASEDNWLQGKTSAPAKGPWAVRMEVMRSDTPNAGGTYEYTLRAWVRQCNQTDCSDVLGTFYQDTRIQYNTTSQRPVHLEQTTELPAADHSDFDTFLFGFTGALVASDDQSALINYFQLSFIRPNDPFVLTDDDWPAP